MQKATINGITYTINGPLNTWDMNYHFINDEGDHLVDLEDVMEFNDSEHGSIELAINMVDELGTDAFWKVN